MAEIAEGGGGGGHHKGEKKRAKKGSTRIDMTPMVDLAFLLLTFFVLTSTFSKPKIMSLAYPAKPKDKVEAPKVYNAITFLLSEDRIFYYKGEFKQGETQLTETSFGADGVRKLLADENKYVLEQKIKLTDRLARKEIVDSIYEKELINAQKHDKALKVLIKTDLKATCKNFIDLIDELRINDIGVVAPVDMMKSEQELLDQKIK
ncbi:MAG TPA: biopolymer transporter ExbD [Fluviicola sp.]|nr:biopolymer transporter ExbD [Fluviicola sp.]